MAEPAEKGVFSAPNTTQVGNDADERPRSSAINLDRNEQQEVKAELNVTEDDLLEARETAATFSLEDVKQVCKSPLSSPRVYPIPTGAHTRDVII